MPALKLPETRRSGGGYRAIAAWRGVENANLSFHKDGIKDWGEDKSYTPIDVVMKALAVKFSGAFDFLSARLSFVHPVNADDGFDVNSFIARNMQDRANKVGAI